MNQESIIKIQMMEQETNQLNEQLQFLEQNTQEMDELINSLEEIKKDGVKEVMVNLGKRIFLPVDIKDKKFFVDVGKGNFVKKSAEEIKKTVEQERDKLKYNKNIIIRKLNDLQEEMEKMINEIQKEQK
ncbi:MAG: prefoldin subunit alpha [Nanoarchaeota archaeon]